MKIASPHLIERVAESIGEDLSRVHQAGTFIADLVVKDTGKLVKQARYGLRSGSARLAEVEKLVAEDFRVRPLPYILGVLGLAALLCLKLSRERQRPS